MAQDLTKRVVAIIADQAMLDPAQVSIDAKIADLGIDSLALVETIFAIEEAFDISVPFNANEAEQAAFDISTVASITMAVEALIAEQKR